MADDEQIHTPPYMVVLLVGAFLVIATISVVYLKIDFPFPFLKLLFCAGVACVLYGLGSTAAVKFDLTKAGQVASAGGAAAIAIFLYWIIPDAPPDPKYKLTYYVSFPGEIVDPESLRATAVVIDVSDPRYITLQQPTWGPAGPVGKVVKVIVPGVSTRESLILKFTNERENKQWSSGPLSATEALVQVYESRGPQP